MFQTERNLIEHNSILVMNSLDSFLYFTLAKMNYIYISLRATGFIFNVFVYTSFGCLPTKCNLVYFSSNWVGFHIGWIILFDQVFFPVGPYLDIVIHLFQERSNPIHAGGSASRRPKCLFPPQHCHLHWDCCLLSHLYSKGQVSWVKVQIYFLKWSLNGKTALFHTNLPWILTRFVD